MAIWLCGYLAMWLCGYVVGGGGKYKPGGWGIRASANTVAEALAVPRGQGPWRRRGRRPRQCQCQRQRQHRAPPASAASAPAVAVATTAALPCIVHVYIGGWGVSPTGKSFRVARACVRAVWLVELDCKRPCPPFPFSLFDPGSLPFSLLGATSFSFSLV